MGNIKSRDGTKAIRESLQHVWISDADRDGCFHCRAPFTLTVRRHHCRSCGELFCKACWGKKVDLPSPLFPTLTKAARQQQPVCEACAKVFDLSAGSVGIRLWNGGIQVRIASAEIKGRRGGLKGSSSASPTKPIAVAAASAPAASQAPSSEDTANAPIYTLRLEKWRPFNRLTCIAVDVVDRSQPRPRAASQPPPTSPRGDIGGIGGGGGDHQSPATSRARLITVPASRDDDELRSSSMPHSLSRASSARARGFAKALTSTSNPAGSPTDAGTPEAMVAPPSAVSFEPSAVAEVSLAPAAPGSTQSSTAHGSTSTSAYLSVPGHSPGTTGGNPDGSSAAAAVGFGGAGGGMPEHWESPLSDLITVSLEAGQGRPAGVRCETKSDIVIYTPVRPEEGPALEDALSAVTLIARKRSVVRVSEGSTASRSRSRSEGVRH